MLPCNILVCSHTEVVSYLAIQWLQSLRLGINLLCYIRCTVSSTIGSAVIFTTMMVDMSTTVTTVIPIAATSFTDTTVTSVVLTTGISVMSTTMTSIIMPTPESMIEFSSIMSSMYVHYCINLLCTSALR